MQFKKQERIEKILNFAMSYYRKHNKMPNIRTIASEVGMDTCSVQKYLVEMAHRGMIDYDRGIVRIHTGNISVDQKSTYNAGVLGSISCGIPEAVEAFVEDYVPLPTSIFGNGELYILRAHGDSMIEAGIDDGDLVVVQKAVEASNGDIVVALVEGTTTMLKRIYYDDENKRIILHPENKTMKDIIVSGCQIQGVAVNVIKRL